MTALRRFGLLAPLAAFSLAGCGLNSVPTAEEQVNAAWGNVQSEYQRRADLVPNLVRTVERYAQQERGVDDDRPSVRATLRVVAAVVQERSCAGKQARVLGAVFR